MKSSKLPSINRLSPDNARRQQQQRLHSIIESPLKFSKNLRVSKNSVYGDDTWSWIDNSNPRLAVYKAYELRIDWDHHKRLYNLTSNITEDLKRYVFLRTHYSETVFLYTKKNAHPYSAISEIRVISAFLAFLRSQLSIGEGNLINDLSDIEVQDLRDCLDDYSGDKASLKRVMSNFGSEILWKHLCSKKLKWNVHDIVTLSWDKEERIPYERLPEKLFSFLSSKAANDVRLFLKALKIKTHDKSKVENETKFLAGNFGDFREAFEVFIKYRIDKEQNFSIIKKLSFIWEGRAKTPFQRESLFKLIK